MPAQPVFLHRNLTYMKERTRRTNRKRSFQVNSLLGIKQQQLQRSRTENGTGAPFGNGMGEFMTLMFLGYHDKSVTDDDVRVEVETNLSHISHKKRKESSNTLQEQVGFSALHHDFKVSNPKITFIPRSASPSSRSIRRTRPPLA